MKIIGSKHILTNLILICLCSFSLYGREKIRHYTVNDGLSQQSVTSIIQDKNDMLWIGTFDGLNRFDGKNFKTFRHHPSDSTSIINNRVLAMVQDDDRDIWILFSDNHIAHYIGDDKFQNYKIDNYGYDLGNRIKVMDIYEKNIFIIDYDNQLTIFNPYGTDDTPRLKAIKRFVKTLGESNQNIISLCSDGNHFWVSTNKHLYYQDESNEFKRLNKYRGYTMKITSRGNLLIWKGSTLKHCMPNYNDAVTTELTEINTYSLPSSILDVQTSMEGELWIGTNKGLYKTNDGKISNIISEYPSRALYNDNLGITWCGGMNGLLSINPYPQPIQNYKPSDDDFSVFNQVNSLEKIPDRNEIIMTMKYKGAYLLELDKDAEEVVSISDAKHITDKNINFLIPVSADTLVYTYKTDMMMSVRENGKFREQVLFEDNYSYSQSICGTKVGDKIWFNRNNLIFNIEFHKGKAVLNENSELNSQMNNKSLIMTMVKSPDDSSIWIGTRGNGAFKIDLENYEVRNFTDITGKKLTSDYVWELFFDSRSRLCIGTDAGLNICNLDSEDFEIQTLTTEDGIRNDKIVSIQEDSEKNLWMSTSQGIICYNPETHKSQTYDSQDGFQSNNFTSCSAKLSDGTMFFGGINGLSWFNPITFSDHSTRPSMYIDKLISGNQVIDRKGKNDGITLKVNDLTIKLLSYYPINPDKVKFRYSINDNPWVEISGNEIILSDLNPRQYKISINCINENQNTSNTEIIKFKVRRHPLLSTLAIIIYVTITLTVILFIIKITLARKMLDNRLKMKEELRVKENKMNSEKMNFYTNMAHEIKTPLSLILGRVYDIEHSGEASPYIVRKAKLIGDNANIIKELTEQILEYKRAISGKLDLQIQEQDILPCILAIIDNYKDYAEKKGIKLEFEASSEKIIKFIDQKKITRIIYNLLSNAIKFSERDDVINIKVTDKDNSLILTVSDTGQGIESKDLPHIFERFYKSGKAGGSGIGLAFTKSLVELMNGTITVHSTYGTGTVFQIRIPDQERYATNVDENIVEVKKKQDITEIKFDSTPQILLVEDNVDLNEYITEILSTRFKVHQCYNAKEALEVLKKTKIDLILTDVMMNGMSGIELANKIKNTKQDAHIPIVFLSAKSSAEDMLEGFQTGAVDYVTKPFNPHILLIKIQNILTQYFLSRKTFVEENNTPVADIPVQNRDEIFINKARDIIYKNLADENFGVNSLSQEMGISRVHLTREFQRIADKSPSTLIKSIRLNHAKHLLSTGEYSIKEVLWEIGIRSHSGFTKAFKEEFGYLPSQFINIEQSKNETHEK